MVLAVAPEALAGETGAPGSEIVAPRGRASPIGKHLRHRLPDGTYLHLFAPLNDRGRLVATVPLGPEGLDRMEAIQRLLADQHRRRSIPRDTRLTAQQKARLRRVLQASDAAFDGATQKQIAEVLFRTGHLDRDEWQVSSARFAVSSLLREGRDLIAGGYRKLLRHQRRL
ncbi:DUF2285 domain-containing protein [Roseovarius pacificus]|uniref:DUF2285 domain-containing protein n=1 Tax=Roseovarius pacificus TaxID=337701 RepID=UPI002A18B676|nr:DUF2285 domain-containing protein [Roseovarius pacificus]